MIDASTHNNNSPISRYLNFWGSPSPLRVWFHARVCQWIKKMGGGAVMGCLYVHVYRGQGCICYKFLGACKETRKLLFSRFFPPGDYSPPRHLCRKKFCQFFFAKMGVPYPPINRILQEVRKFNPEKHSPKRTLPPAIPNFQKKLLPRKFRGIGGSPPLFTEKSAK